MNGINQGTFVPPKAHRLGEKMQNDLRIHRRLENRPFGLKFLPQFRRVGQVAIVGDGDLPLDAVHGQRLGISKGG